ncbi:LrgB-like family-domain-containing protein [Hypoxylon sp. FL1857]|nr:LrgB-like family-domain-containing protein [Hypoxylon sp. FL1857]
MNSLTQQLCRGLQTPATTKRYRDAGIGFAFIVLTQFVVIPIQITLDTHSINFPASILVMLLFSLLTIVANYIHEGTAELYSKYLHGPTDFLGRHMSFGFVASFVLLNRDHISDAIDVPRIAGAFLITTLMGYVGTYVVALGSFEIEKRFRGRRTKAHDLESGNKSWPSPSAAWPAPSTGRPSKRPSQFPHVGVILLKNRSLSLESAKRGSASQLIDHIARTAPLWICITLIAIVGIPVYFTTHYEAPFEALCFVLFWILSIQFQKSLKASCGLLRFLRLRSALVILANPVLVTWALGTAYLWIKTAYTGRSIDTVISEFRAHNTLAESIIAIREGNDLRNHIGAGDLTGPILDAGIVCLGFKMFEYRKELWQSFATVLTACSTLALSSVFLNVLVARALRLQPADSLAFAARSVTIALGIPIMQNLQGSTTLMSVLVILGGILFQMIGDWLFSLLRISDRKCQDKSNGSGVTEKARGVARESQQRSGAAESAVIAAGVTVGINAAAMGTAFLIERDSRATAYSALSMTVFGAMTVALTTPLSVSGVIISLVSR